MITKQAIRRVGKKNKDAVLTLKSLNVGQLSPRHTVYPLKPIMSASEAKDLKEKNKTKNTCASVAP